MDAISFIYNSFKLKKAGYKSWIVNLVVGLIFLAFSIYIMVNAKNISYLLIRFIGGFLIIDAISQLTVRITFTSQIYSVEFHFLE